MGREGPSYLADVPLDRVQAVAAVRKVRDADVLGSWQQILDPHREQGAERYLKRITADVNVCSRGGAGVQVDAVGADADAVVELRGAVEAVSLFDADVLFKD